ncbi:hypothetical protein M1403_03840 [Patescibacteria group bacterium]|nr:hypothetical protein [Patescibacteria group bacterium]
MALSPDRYTFKNQTSEGEVTVKNGISELWMLSSAQQEGILAQAMVRWEQCNGMTFESLGIKITAADLVRPNNLYPSSRLNDRDILSALVTGTLELYPSEAIKNLTKNGIDVGIWDGVFGSPGHYYVQDHDNEVLIINPGDREHISKLWKGPKEIQRVRQLHLPRIDYDCTLNDHDGGIIMEFAVAHLFGIWPAIRMTDLNASLETRSNAGRWCQAGAVNSVTAQQGFTGVITAEATSYAQKPEVWGTSWLPYQFMFNYVQPGLNREYTRTFSDAPVKTAEEAARDFRPEMMLPRLMKRQRSVISFPISNNGHH